MASSLRIFLCLILFTTLSLAVPDPPVHHGGPLLTGDVNLALMWYGPFGRVHKRVIRQFLNSLNYNGGGNLQPKISAWWNVVESYQSFSGTGAPGPAPPIRVKVVKQTADVNYSVGKVLTVDFFNALTQKALAGAPPGSIAVIIGNREVTVQDLCTGKCALHGLAGQQPYIAVGNPETECPGSCGWPFYPADFGPKGDVLKPPNKNIGADAMVIALASGLAEIVTNPFNTGFYSGTQDEPTGISAACPYMFGSGAQPGFAGTVQVDPETGGAFNAYGVRGRKFLLPAIWNPKTSSCYTTM